MKLRCVAQLKNINTSVEEIIDVDEKELIGMRGYQAKNYLYNKLQDWANSISFIDYEIIEGYSEPDLPYFEKPLILDDLKSN